MKESLKRFWLFGGIKYNYYPCGALQDFLKSYDSVDDAVYDAKRKEFNSLKYPSMYAGLEWYQVLDTQTNEVVAHGGEFFGNSDCVQTDLLVEADVR